jgi:hypothetical protein
MTECEMDEGQCELLHVSFASQGVLPAAKTSFKSPLVLPVRQMPVPNVMSSNGSGAVISVFDDQNVEILSLTRAYCLLLIPLRVALVNDGSGDGSTQAS